MAKKIISSLIHQEWGRVTERIDIDHDGNITLKDPDKPVLTWAQYIPPDLADAVDGTEVFCVYNYIGELTQFDPSSKKRKEIARTVRYVIRHRDIEQCEIYEDKMKKALLATRRIVDYSAARNDPDKANDLRGLAREMTILY